MHTQLRVSSLPFISLFPKWQWASRVFRWALLPSAPIRSHQWLWNNLQGHIFASLRCYFWKGHLGNHEIKISSMSLCTSLVYWVPKVMELDLTACAVYKTVFPSGAQVYEFTPESQRHISVNSESQANLAHLPLFHRNDFTLWCARSRSNFICRSNLTTIEQMNTLRKMRLCNSLLRLNVA